MAPLAGALVGYLSMFLQLGILTLLAGLAVLVRTSLGRRKFDGWTAGLIVYASALAFLVVVTLGRVLVAFPGVAWATVVYAVLEDIAAVIFVTTVRRERGVPPLPRWLTGLFLVAVAATISTAFVTPSFFAIYRVHVGFFAVLLALAAFEGVRARATGLGAQLLTAALAALAIDYGHIPLLTLFGVRFIASYPALESYLTMVLDIVLGVAIVVHMTDGVRTELEQRNAALADAQRALHDAAYLDALCQVPNRAAFIDRMSRPPAAGTVAMIDVDGLKAINDRFGHAVGDTTLSTAARCLRERCGPSATAYRIGGDEFAAIWDRVGSNEARTALAALDADLNALANAMQAPPRLSWGVAEFGPGVSFDTALVAADAELYERRSASREQA